MLRLDRNSENTLGEDVDELRSRQDVKDTNVPDGNTLVDKVKINLNILDALVLNGVDEEVDGVDVVAAEQSGPRQGGYTAPQAADEANTPLPRH
jgi:hypothetical protein